MNFKPLKRTLFDMIEIVAIVLTLVGAWLLIKGISIAVWRV